MCVEFQHLYQCFPLFKVAFFFCYPTWLSFSCGAALLYVGLFCCQEGFCGRGAVDIYLPSCGWHCVVILRCGCVDICGFVPSGGQLWGLPSISWPHPGGKGGEGWVRWITTRRKRGMGGDRLRQTNLKIAVLPVLSIFSLNSSSGRREIINWAWGC